MNDATRLFLVATLAAACLGACSASSLPDSDGRAVAAHTPRPTNPVTAQVPSTKPTMPDQQPCLSLADHVLTLMASSDEMRPATAKEKQNFASMMVTMRGPIYDECRNVPYDAAEIRCGLAARSTAELSQCHIGKKP